jgi:hypothetical protein
MTASVFYANPDDAGAAVETLRVFGIRAVCIVSTVAELDEGTEQTQWEVIALELPAQQSGQTRAVGPTVDPHEDDFIGSAWDWEREDERDRHREF